LRAHDDLHSAFIEILDRSQGFQWILLGPNLCQFVGCR
jgi:hypothetical protein